MFLVDIRKVPSEMPMYLLAEDEGNEEEILRLLESESPGGSPYTCAVRTISASSPPDSITEEQNSITPHNSSLGTGAPDKSSSDSEYKLSLRGGGETLLHTSQLIIL